MTSDPTDGLTLTYDPENRIQGAGGYTYTYDADGNRVKKTNGSTGTIYWYMTPGIVAESDLSGTLKSEYVFFDGERVARRDLPAGAVAYYFSDHLKTASVITDSLGNIKSESDYYPWGGELQFVNNDSNHYKFTGKERDETGLDYFGARYYSNGLARFITPDWAAKATAVPYAEFADPQSLNLYSYVRNVPTVKVDADGHCVEDACIVEGIAIGAVIRVIARIGAGVALGYVMDKIRGHSSAAVPPPSVTTTTQTGTPGTTGTTVQAGTPGTSTTTTQTGAPASTSQAGEVSTSTANTTNNNGSIYIIPGSGTPSGRPYVGRHNKPDPARTRRSNDGRDRKQAKVVDNYPAEDTPAGRVAEQKHMDENGGIENLDNKRNEIKKPK